MMKLHSNLMEVFDLVSKKIICFVSALILGLSPFLSLGNVVYASENSPGTLPTVDMDRINTFEEDTSLKIIINKIELISYKKVFQINL
mgnify:CR=1 FL=1